MRLAGMSRRPLTDEEQELLAFLLSGMGGRAASLLPQLEGAEVVDEDDPTTWIQIKVRPDAAPVDLPDAPIPGSALVEDADGELTGELFVWTVGGKLDALHQASYTDASPPSMPPVGSVRIVPAPRWA